MLKLLRSITNRLTGPSNHLSGTPTYNVDKHYAQVHALYIKWPYRTLETIQEFERDTIDIIARKYPVHVKYFQEMKRPGSKHLPLLQGVISDLYSLNSLTFLKFPCDKDRKELKHYQELLRNPKERIEEVELAVITMFYILFDKMREPAPAKMFVPAKYLVNDYAQTVFTMMHEIAQHLHNSSHLLTKNVLRISGINPDKPGSKDMIMPPDYNGDPTEYLEDATSFSELLDAMVPFHIPRETWASHGIILAPPRFGKSQLLQTLIVDMLEQEDPVGMFVLDPHGDLFNKLKNRVDPSRLVVIDPDTNPPPLNFLDFGSSSEPQILATFTYLMSSLSGGLSDKQSGTTPYLLKLLRAIPNASLVTLRAIIDEKVTRADQSQFWKYIQSFPDEIDRGFFENQFFHTSMDVTKKAIGAKIYAAMGSDTFRKMFGAKTNSLNFDQLIADRKVVLFKGAYDSLGDEGMEIFLQYIIAQYYAAGRRRERIPEQERHLTMMYVDEAHTVLKSPIISKILVELRKFGCGFVAATQVLDQIADEVKASVYGATAIKIVGPVSSASGDAGQLAKDMYCHEQFIRSMKSVPKQYADWAFYAAATTDRAVKVRLPYGALEAIPEHAEREFLAKHQQARAKTQQENETSLRDTELPLPPDDDDPVMKKK